MSGLIPGLTPGLTPGLMSGLTPGLTSGLKAQSDQDISLKSDAGVKIQGNFRVVWDLGRQHQDSLISGVPCVQ